MSALSVKTFVMVASYAGLYARLVRFYRSKSMATREKDCTQCIQVEQRGRLMQIQSHDPQRHSSRSFPSGRSRVTAIDPSPIACFGMISRLIENEMITSDATPRPISIIVRPKGRGRPGGKAIDFPWKNEHMEITKRARVGEIDMADLDMVYLFSTVQYSNTIHRNLKITFSPCGNFCSLQQQLTLISTYPSSQTMQIFLARSLVPYRSSSISPCMWSSMKQPPTNQNSPSRSGTGRRTKGLLAPLSTHI